MTVGWCSTLGWVVESDTNIIPQTLVTLEEVKSWFGEDVYSNTDAQKSIDICLKSAYANIKSYCNRNFSLYRYKEILKSSGTDTFMLKNYPLASIELFKINDSAVTNAIYEVGVDSNGIIYLPNITNIGDMIAIEYIAGYPAESIPFDLKHANLLQASFFFKRFGSNNDSFTGMKSISKMGEQITKEDTSASGLISEVIGLLNPYIRCELPSIMAHQGVI